MPRRPDRVTSGTLPDFDDFYLTSRRRLVLSAYALTGDLSAARNAVSDAFVAARHHWRKVGRLPDPEEWVRPRAWAMAQRRHVARLWHREKGLNPDQKGVLDALHRLPDQQRKVLLLAQLAALSPAEIGRELGETEARVEERLVVATASFCRATERVPEEVGAAVELLAPIAEAAALRGPATIHRDGQSRRLLHTLGGGAVLLALVLLAGVFVVRGGVEQSAAAGSTKADTKPVTDEMLLSLPQVQLLAPRESWRLVRTSDNTSGSGINSVCQATRFADPRGKGTKVRTFATDGPANNRRRVVQTVEISRSSAASEKAYRTTLGWFAGCSQARLQLLGAFRVRGLGEEAQMLKLRIPNAVRRTYVVGLARTGSLTVSTVSETLGRGPVAVNRAVTTLTDAVRNVCDSDPSGPCPSAVRAAPVLPPPSGETPGTLAVADLPVIGRINRPWVGTRPVPAKPNIAATTCDKADFARAGAPRAITRTFLIPQADLAKRFGIAESVGAFPTRNGAHGLVSSISAAMARCEKKDLGAQVSRVVIQPKGYRGSEYAMWRLDSEINDKSKVGFWMGVARVGRYVAQVNFTPSGDNDVDEDTFQALISRARDRLFELPRERTMNGFELTDGLVYLDGNSLGALPSGVAERMQDVVRREWGAGLIRSWNDAKWMELSARIAGRIAPLIGVSPGDVHVGDSTSVSLFKTTVAAARLRPDRRVLVVEPSTFPTDGYIISGVADLMGLELRWCDPADPLAAVDEDVALLSLTHVDFRTGAMFDMAAITREAQARGALVQWDLCHSAGAVPVDLSGASADFAVGCTYKYLNGGPGSPAFIWVAPQHQADARQPITGWMGHRQPFAMARDYEPASGVGAFASGTPPVLALSALEASLSAFDGVSVADLRSRSLELTDAFISLVEERLPGVFELLTPRSHEQRGSQVSLRHESAYGVVQALIAREVIGDFRDPDVARFGFAPLYNTLDDVRVAVERLELVIANEEHLDPSYGVRNAVT